MRYVLGFLGVLVIVGFINGIGYSSLSQDRAMSRNAVIGHIKENIVDSLKLYGVGVLLIRLLH